MEGEPCQLAFFGLPEGRDKVAGGSAPGKRSAAPGPTLQGSRNGGARVEPEPSAGAVRPLLGR